jgi:hypothetical protein
LSTPGILSNPQNKLFPSKFQYNRYASINKVIRQHQAKFARIGVKPGTIGTHSARKGAAIYAASGCTICAGKSAICNRAGWRLGGTLDKYIKYELAACDQFLGRTLCGLKSATKTFSMYPPFFNMNEEEFDKVDRILMSFVADGSVIAVPTFEVCEFALCAMLCTTINSCVIIYIQAIAFAPIHQCAIFFM